MGECEEAPITVTHVGTYLVGAIASQLVYPLGSCGQMAWSHLLAELACAMHHLWKWQNPTSLCTQGPEKKEMSVHTSMRKHYVYIHRYAYIVRIYL